MFDNQVDEKLYFFTHIFIIVFHASLSAISPVRGAANFVKIVEGDWGCFPQQAKTGERFVHPFSDFWQQKALLAETVTP